MKRSCFVKVLCLAFSLVILLSSFSVFAGAEIIANPMHQTYVCDDLETMGYDLSEYHRDESADFVSIIDFTEYGYDVNGDQTYYGLYIYLYNPSGRKLETSGNYIEMSFNHKESGETRYLKYPLRIMSVSRDSSNANVFYKLFVNNSQAIGENIGKYRTYSLSAIELKYADSSSFNAKSYKLGGAYSFSGYMENFGAENLKLSCSYTNIEVIDVELRSASWFTDTSDLGEDYRYEVSSVYFNIPNYFVEKYGNLEDETSGLYSVQGSYYKYVTNGLVVDDSNYFRYENYAGILLSTEQNYEYHTTRKGYGFYSFSDAFLDRYDYVYEVSYNAYAKEKE